VGISATIPCVPEDFLARYYGYISRRRIKECRKHNDATKKPSAKQGIVAEILTKSSVSFFMQPGPGQIV